MKMKKIKIIPCDENVIAQLPNIMGFLEDLFGNKEIRLYATLENNKLGFVGENDDFSVLIDSEGNYTIFTIGEDGKICSIYKDNYSVFFNDNKLSYIIDDDKVEYSVSYCPLEEKDKDGYNGNVSFNQYNPENDVFCSIVYQHLYREKDGNPYIFSEHTKCISRLYIDEDYSTTPEHKVGLLPKRAKYFRRYTFKEGELGFNIVACKEYGALKVAKEGAVSLLKAYKVVRYVKSLALLPNDEFCDSWPLSKQYVEKDLKTLINSYGLKTDLPQLFIDLYNDEDGDVERIKEIIMDLNEIKRRENPQEDNLYLKLILAE